MRNDSRNLLWRLHRFCWAVFSNCDYSQFDFAELQLYARNVKSKFPTVKNMNMTLNNVNSFAALAALFAIASTIFWMVVGWRAMRAHERIADASEQAAKILGDHSSI